MIIPVKKDGNDIVLYNSLLDTVELKTVNTETFFDFVLPSMLKHERLLALRHYEKLEDGKNTIVRVEGAYSTSTRKFSNMKAYLSDKRVINIDSSLIADDKGLEPHILGKLRTMILATSQKIFKTSCQYQAVTAELIDRSSSAVRKMENALYLYVDFSGKERAVNLYSDRIYRAIANGINSELHEGSVSQEYFESILSDRAKRMNAFIVVDTKTGYPMFLRNLGLMYLVSSIFSAKKTKEILSINKDSAIANCLGRYYPGQVVDKDCKKLIDTCCYPVTTEDNLVELSSVLLDKNIGQFIPIELYGEVERWFKNVKNIKIPVLKTYFPYTAMTQQLEEVERFREEFSLLGDGQDLEEELVNAAYVLSDDNVLMRNPLDNKKRNNSTVYHPFSTWGRTINAVNSDEKTFRVQDFRGKQVSISNAVLFSSMTMLLFDQMPKGGLQATQFSGTAAVLMAAQPGMEKLIQITLSRDSLARHIHLWIPMLDWTETGKLPWLMNEISKFVPNCPVKFILDFTTRTKDLYDGAVLETDNTSVLEFGWETTNGRKINLSESNDLFKDIFIITIFMMAIRNNVLNIYDGKTRKYTVKKKHIDMSRYSDLSSLGEFVGNPSVFAMKHRAYVMDQPLPLITNSINYMNKVCKMLPSIFNDNKEEEMKLTTFSSRLYDLANMQSFSESEFIELISKNIPNLKKGVSVEYKCNVLTNEVKTAWNELIDELSLNHRLLVRKEALYVNTD